jgi:hypothetical protein
MIYYTAIVFFRSTDKMRPRKYRNINNLQSFKQFVIDKVSGAIYYNLYDKATKSFIKKEWIESNFINK